MINLSPDEVREYYRHAPLQIPEVWRLTRKHVRAEMHDGKFVKFNRFRNRINARSLRMLCMRYAPVHVYMSVLDWDFPDRVGRKKRAIHAYPTGGDYVVDVDAQLFSGLLSHLHQRGQLCLGCLQLSKDYAIHMCDLIEENYSSIAIVFSGMKGFHIHVLDFPVRDWAKYDESDPIKSHEVARLHYTKHLCSRMGVVFDKAHFTLSVDPMRIISVPQTLNASSGLICTYVGGRRDLEGASIGRIVEESKPTRLVYPVPVTPERLCRDDPVR